MMEYPVYRGTETIGKLRLERQGLYYRLSCRCALSEGLYRLNAYSDRLCVDLGTLVPMGDGFGLDTRFPVKRLGTEALRFSVHGKTGGVFVPISPEEPFRYIERLKHSFLEIQNGRMGITVPEAMLKK